MFKENKIYDYKDYPSTILNQIDTFFGKPVIKKVCFGLIIIVSFILIYILNILHPLFGDDWNYCLLPDGHTKIKSFSDILYTQYEHYFTWGGRTIVHIIAQSLLLAGISIGDFINSLVYVAFTLIIYRIANQSNKIRPSLLLAINLLIWFFQPALGSTILWITGSANYLWGTLIILCFLLTYTKQVLTPTNKNSYLRSVLFFIAGIIAGWTNENMAVSLIAMLIAFIGYYKIKHGKIPLWAITGLIGAIIGCAIMIAAPGNYARMDNVLSQEHVNESFITIFIGRFAAAIAGYYYFVLVPTFVFAIILYLYRSFGKKTDKPVLFIALIFVMGAIVATLAMSASPIFPGRAAFGIITLFFLAICILYAHLDFSVKLVPQVIYTTIIFGLLLFIADYYRGYRELQRADKILQARILVIESGKKEGKKDFIFNDRIFPEGRSFHYFDLSHDPNDWHNRMFSAYYEINSVIVK